MTQLGGTEYGQLNHLLVVLNHFQQLDQEFPPQQMQVLIEVAKAPGITISQLASRTNQTVASISRHVQKLSRDWSVGRTGLDLMIAETNPANRREKNVTLTKKGQRFVTTLIDLLTNNSHSGDSVSSDERKR